MQFSTFIRKKNKIKCYFVLYVLKQNKKALSVCEYEQALHFSSQGVFLVKEFSSLPLLRPIVKFPWISMEQNTFM